MTEPVQSAAGADGNKGKTLHALSVDVEDYFHVAALSKVISQEDWGSLPSRVERNTERLLELFDRQQVKCTFFVLGWVAERYPHLIRKLADHGHEIASHGYSHQLVYNQTPAVFTEETRKSKAILEDIIQQPVTGYRAASYSITRESLWALDILAELGFTWDSSIFPIHHDRYGIPDSPKTPYTIQTSNGTALREFPLTTARLFRMTIPAAGEAISASSPTRCSGTCSGWPVQETPGPRCFTSTPGRSTRISQGTMMPAGSRASVTTPTWISVTVGWSACWGTSALAR